MKRHSKSAPDRPLAGTQAVVRALRLLRAFTDARPEWSLADLSRELKLSKPTAYRLLAALEDGGLVVRQEPAGAYRLALSSLIASCLAGILCLLAVRETFARPRS